MYGIGNGISAEPRTLVKKTVAKFHPGQKVLITQGAKAAFECSPDDDLRSYLDRHFTGDYGEMGVEDCARNEASIKNGSRIMSAYRLLNGTRIWIITDAAFNDIGERWATTILLPEEY